jgi:hypothetical protein
MPKWHGRYPIQFQNYRSLWSLVCFWLFLLFVPQRSNRCMFNDQELRILTSEEMTNIKKRSWMNCLLIFILLINGHGWPINWYLYMLMFSLINDGFHFLWPGWNVSEKYLNHGIWIWTWINCHLNLSVGIMKFEFYCGHIWIWKQKLCNFNFDLLDLNCKLVTVEVTAHIQH